MCLIFAPPILNSVPHAPLMNRDGNGDDAEDGGGGGRRSGGGGVLECGAGPDVLNYDGNGEDDYDEGCTVFSIDGCYVGAIDRCRVSVLRAMGTVPSDVAAA